MNEKQPEDHDAHVRTRAMIERLRQLPKVELEFTPERPDDEVKKAIHSAHDARDPAYIAEIKAQKIRRFRSGEWFPQSRWTENDQKDRGNFPADVNALGNIDYWIDALAAEAMINNPQLTLDAARDAARKALNPRNLRIRDPGWSAERQRRRFQRARAKRTEDPNMRRQERERIKAYRAANPEKVKAARVADALAEKAARAKRGPKLFVAVDSEGFDTGRYFAHEDGIPRDDEGRKITNALDVRGLKERQDKWTLHGRDWYASAHESADGDEPTAQNKIFPGDIYREHKSFLWGAGNNEKQERLCTGEDGKPKVALTAPEIFDWLIGLNKKFRHAIFVGFSFSYDATMALAGIDYEAALALQKGERRLVSDEEYEEMSEKEREDHIERVETVFWEGFAIAYRKGKMFRVGRLRNPANPWRITPITNPEKKSAFEAVGLPAIKRAIDYAPGGPVTINDTFGFFQSSFLEALDGMKMTLGEDENRILEEGKANRRRMALLPLDQVERYQTVELFALCRIMNKLRSGLHDLGLDLQRWQGAGAIAEAMLKKERATHFFPWVDASDIRPEQEWAHYAFFGGRIELVKQGRYAGDYYAYDVTSAYPAIMSELPAMVIPQYARDDIEPKKPIRRRRGKWIRRDGLEINFETIARMSPLSIVEIEFDFPTDVLDRRGRTRKPPFYPLPYRREDGAILYPARGRGRYYRNEILAAIKWLDVLCSELTPEQRRGRIGLLGAFEFVPPDKGKTKPFAFLKRYYDERRAIDAAAEASGTYDVREKVIKLGINSVYGKTAQSVGGRSGHPPNTANPWVAGAITAGTRAELVRAALKNPWAVILFATDGIQSLEPFGVESATKTLGGWEKETLTAGVWIKPGVCAYSRMEKGKTKYTGKSRGMSINSILGDVALEDRDELWFRYLDDMARDLWTRGERSIWISHERLVTFGFAVSSEENWRLAGYWLETDRELDVNDAGIKRNDCSNPRRARGLVPLSIAENETPDVMSRIYSPEWLDDTKRIAGEWMQDNHEIALARFDEEVWDVSD
jgi:hypothetical protein